MGWMADCGAGLCGSVIGEALVGHWGPLLAGIGLIASIIGAIIVVAVVSFFLSRSNK